MSKRTLTTCFALIVLALPPTQAATGIAHGRLPLVDLVTRVIPLIPGSTSRVEALLDAPAGAAKTARGWRHAPIRYRTADGVTLNVTVMSDWDAKTPDVVRLLAAVDPQQCIDAARLRSELSDNGRVQWTSIGINEGWSATIQGRFVALGQRTGRCLASVIVDTRRQPRPMQPTRPLRIGPSGRPETVPLPER